jgi:multidrug resistance efflux pump
VDQVIDRWLALLCQLLPGVTRAVAVRRDGGLMGQWPDGEVQELVALCQVAGGGEATQYRLLPSGLTLVAVPLHNRQIRVGDLCLELPLKPELRATTELLMRWSQAWLELLSDNNRERSIGLETVLYTLEQGSRFDRLPDNASALATALVEKIGLRRVLVCLPYRGRIRVTGVSHAPAFDHRSEMFSLLENYLMQTPEAEAAHEQSEYQRWLSTRHPVLHFTLIPLWPGAYIVLLFPADKSPTNSARAQIRQIARLVAPLYQSQNQLRHGILWQWRESLRRLCSDGNQRKKALWIAVAAVLLVVFLALPGRHRVAAQGTLEGIVQRAIVAPEDGYLQEASVQAGAVIRQGQLLAQLDDKTIQLEIQRWLGEKQEYERQYNRELTALNPVEMRIAKAKLAQAEAQLDLYRDRLRRVRITAPIDGVIIKGDLSRAVGSPVQRGQVLYEIAPLNEFKLILQVQEKSIRFIKVGQRGLLRLSAMPHDSIAFNVTAVASVYSEHQQNIVYRVEAEMSQKSAHDLRPGMSGYAKIQAENKPYVWLIGHGMWDWLTLKLWWL